MKRHAEMSDFLEQRIVIKFCVKLGWTFVQIKTSLHATFPQVLCNASVYKWIAKFRTGRDSVVDKPRAAKPKTGRSRHNIRRIEDLITADRRVTLRELSQKSDLAFTTMQRIVKKDLKLVKKCAKFVPHDLTNRNKERRQAIYHFWTRLALHSPRILRRTVTCDESWVYIYDPQMRQQSKEWLRHGEARPQKPRREIATAKVMVVTFFDSKGLIYFEYVQRPLTVNQRVFRAIFRHFHEAYQRRRPHSSIRGHHFFHFDNAPAHTTDLTVQLIHQLGWTHLPHPAYSPDLAPSDFWLYARLKKNLRGIQYGSLDELKEAVSDDISAIPSGEYKRCMLHSWPWCWRCCLAAQGQYFEGCP